MMPIPMKVSTTVFLCNVNFFGQMCAKLSEKSYVAGKRDQTGTFSCLRVSKYNTANVKHTEYLNLKCTHI